MSKSPTIEEALRQLIIYHGCDYLADDGEPCLGGLRDIPEGEEPCIHCVAELVLKGDRPLSELELAVLRFDP